MDFEGSNFRREAVIARCFALRAGDPYMSRSRSWAALAVLSVLLLLSAPVAGFDAGRAASAAGEADALWIADATEVLKLGVAEAQLEVEVPRAAGSRAIAVDRAAGVMWAYGDEGLRGFDLGGELLIDVGRAGLDESVDRAASGGRAANGGRAFAQAGGGRVWIAEGTRVRSFDLTGREV